MINKLEKDTKLVFLQFCKITSAKFSYLLFRKISQSLHKKLKYFAKCEIKI